MTSDRRWRCNSNFYTILLCRIRHAHVYLCTLSSWRAPTPDIARMILIGSWGRLDMGWEYPRRS